MERFLVERMGKNEDVRSLTSGVQFFTARTALTSVSKNIHQLPKSEFIECLHDLYFREQKDRYGDFFEMLYGKFGKRSRRSFSVPTMKSFTPVLSIPWIPMQWGGSFPYADLEDVMRNMKASDNSSYNGTFTYPLVGDSIRQCITA